MVTKDHSSTKGVDPIVIAHLPAKVDKGLFFIVSIRSDNATISGGYYVQQRINNVHKQPPPFQEVS